MQTLTGHTNWLFAVAFSPDSTTLAAGSADRKIKLWHVADGSPIRTLAGHTGGVKSVAFSPDGSMLASAGDD